MASKELINKLQHELDEEYNRFKSKMTIVLKEIVDERIRVDHELSENEEVIEYVHQYITDNLTDTLWDTIGDMIADISTEAKMEYSLGEYKPTKEDIRLFERERDSEGL